MMKIESVKLQSYSRRCANGSLLLLILVLAVVVILLGAFSLDIVTTLFNQQLLESRANSLALKTATALNAGDRVGRLNHLVVGSRELVYRSRQKFYKTNQFPFDHLRPLAQQLLDQARDGATLLEEERKRLIIVRLLQIKAIFVAEGLGLDGMQNLKSSRLGQLVEVVNLGNFNDQTAEVSSALSDPDLRDYDLKRTNVDKLTGTYFGQIDARLPDDDSDLSFKLNKLPPVGKASALNNIGRYKQSALFFQRGKEVLFNLDHMPTVVNLKLSANYKTLFTNRPYTLSATATATCSGPAFR